ncbi:MAG: P-loop NTPase [Candidatus Omnitrophota bacterium]
MIVIAKQIVVVSGKGGTGKTVVTGSFAVLDDFKIIVDCDVDAANLHLLLNSKIHERHIFKSGVSPRLDEALCNGCGSCFGVCHFGALGKVSKEGKVVPSFDPMACQGCGLCAHVCPAKAIEMVENIAGEWFLSSTKYGPFYHARLKAAAENSGKLVARIKKEAMKLATLMKTPHLLVDGPPGIGCPVIASLSGARLAVVVTEPTISGIHDVERIIGLAKTFRIPVKVIINKYDLAPEKTGAIEAFCQQRGIEVLGRIPFSPLVVEAVIRGIPVVEYDQGEIAASIKSIWQKVIAYCDK